MEAFLLRERESVCVRKDSWGFGRRKEKKRKKKGVGVRE